MLAEALTALALVSPAGCQTQACERRVRIIHMQRVIRPYRGWLERLRACESGDTNNRGYHRGYYQFTWETWRAAGGTGDPADASKLEQGYRAVRWRQRIGNPKQTAGWPVCG